MTLIDRLLEIAQDVSPERGENIREAIDELKRLDRLPKTRDGVTIVIGDQLWTVCDVGPVIVEAFRKPAVGKRWQIQTSRGTRYAEQCYSTREAAEKARE